MYQSACRHLSVEPEDCVYVADGQSDELNGAKRVGMEAVLISIPTEDTYEVHRSAVVEWDGPVSQNLDSLNLLSAQDRAYALRYNGGMKVKTSVTLSEELLTAIEAQTGADAVNRSALIEQAMWDYLRFRQRAARDKNEIARINAQSAELNEEALDTIDYQVDK